MRYGHLKETNMKFDEVISKVKNSLKDEGFGILTEIDVKDTLKKKLNVEYEDYTILGVCNPPFAYEALQAEKEIGLLLPCNVVIYATDGKILISSINPEIAMSMIENRKIEKIAQQIGDKLRRIIDGI